MTTWTRGQLGALGEQAAADHLQAQGWQILDRNWRCRYGEIDLIATDNDSGAVVFVEVKTRSGDGFGGIAEAVPRDKVRRLRRLAALWLVQQSRSWSAVRIDVIGVRVGRTRTPELVHLKGVG